MNILKTQNLNLEWLITVLNVLWLRLSSSSAPLFHPIMVMDNMEGAQSEFQVYLTGQRFPFFLRNPSATDKLKMAPECSHSEAIFCCFSIAFLFSYLSILDSVNQTHSNAYRPNSLPRQSQAPEEAPESHAMDYSRSSCSLQSFTHASLGIRRSPRGDTATLPTFGPSGRQERLNCCAKNLQ